MIDFKEMSEDGEIWELFARDFLQKIGFFIESSPDRGPDGGKDLLVTEELSGILGKYKFRWLVSCKNFARSNRSVTENEEQNIVERVAGFNADGFIVFYSTIPSSGLNIRLGQLKNNQKIKDYKIFDCKLIENYLIRIGFSDILMRYFPKSYKNVKPLHLITSKYLPLKCAKCGKDILMEMFNNQYQANIVFAEKCNSETGQIHVEDIYWACKGECDRELQNYYRNELSLSTPWKDIGDLIIPVLFLSWLMADLNNLREQRYIYSEKGIQKIKRFYNCFIPESF